MKLQALLKSGSLVEIKRVGNQLLHLNAAP